jgi:hypothetical protein
MHPCTVPGGVHSITTARPNDTAPFSALGTIVKIYFHHAWTQHFRHIQPVLLGLSKHGAIEGSYEKRLLLAYLKKMALPLPGCGGFDGGFLSIQGHDM